MRLHDATFVGESRLIYSDIGYVYPALLNSTSLFCGISGLGGGMRSTECPSSFIFLLHSCIDVAH